MLAPPPVAHTFELLESCDSEQCEVGGILFVTPVIPLCSRCMYEYIGCVACTLLTAFVFWQIIIDKGTSHAYRCAVRCLYDLIY